jgi:hypothetical protein
LTILLFAFPCVVLAQSTDAALTGLVDDPSKAMIAGAQITAINTLTGERTSTSTNSSGQYVIPNLPPGSYRIEVDKEGFKGIIEAGLVLHVQDVVQINFHMAVGSMSESVTVNASDLTINTTDGSVSTVVDSKMVENMPLNGRSFQDLILLTPGAVTQTPQISQSGAIATGIGATGEFSVNGQRPESNYYSVDGVSGNVGATSGLGMETGAGPSGSVAESTALGTTQALVSVDDLQEFRVQSSTYSAEYGRNPGAQFSFDTKSGTNQLHGTAFDYLRNGVFDAPDWFNDYFDDTEPELRQNDFGGTLGGPVEAPHIYNGKNKTFFFVSYEGLWLAAPQAANVSYVPDLALRASTPAPLNQVLNAFPLPSANGIDDSANGIAQFIGSWSNPASLDSSSIRFDHAVNDKLRLFFRFSDTPSSSATRGNATNLLAPTMNSISAYTLRTYTAGVSNAFSSRFSNQFRLNYTSNETTTSTVIDPFGGSTPVNLLQLAGLNTGAEPQVALYYSGYQVFLYEAEQSGAQKQWNFVDSFSLSLGRHQIKLGVDYRRLTPFAILPTPEVAYYYLDPSSVETNSAYTSPIVYASVYPLYLNFSAFVQDEWRLSKRLNLSFGLRWEVNPAPSVTQGLKPYTTQGSDPNTVTLAPQGTPLWQTSWFNFAPRLGAAYILHDTPGWETVVRGGGGVFFDTGQQLGSLGFNGPGFVGEGSFLPGSFPGSVTIPVIANPPQPPYAVYGFASHLQLPFTLQWNASVEQALGKSQALTVSYVGSHAARLLQLNQFQPTNNPNVYFYYFVENGLTSDYNSLQVQLRRRLSQGLTALASYSFSHCIDYGSQNYLLSYQRGDCDFDVRHSFSTAFSYDVPDVGHDGFASTVLHHWGLDDRFTARAAFPVTLNGNEIPQPNGQLYYGGLSFVPGQPVYLYGANCTSTLLGLGDLTPTESCPGGRAINPNAFTAVGSGLGDAPRNFARGLGAWQMDTAIRREFPIHERLKLQFRAETFNIFNHPNFGVINPNFGTSTFGQFTGTLANSLGVLSPLYQQGGPRSMQFALKVIF